MKLRRLTLCGIGPFHKEQVIDFHAFDAAGLFLLEGPTGAGKSTLVDAITFALYGDVARQSDSDRSRMRSSYCQGNDRSWVELVFEVSRGIYRVTRTPKYTRPGRKTDVNATIHLEKVVESSGNFISVDVISRSIAEADREIRQCVGLNKDQFLQTIVLPQGKFSRFLIAKSDERESILRDVFGAGFYLKLQEELRARAHTSNTHVESARSALEHTWEIFHALTDDLSTGTDTDTDTDTASSTIQAHLIDPQYKAPDSPSHLVTEKETHIPPDVLHSYASTLSQEKISVHENTPSVLPITKYITEAHARIEHLRSLIVEAQRQEEKAREHATCLHNTLQEAQVLSDKLKQRSSLEHVISEREKDEEHICVLRTAREKSSQAALVLSEYVALKQAEKELKATQEKARSAAQKLSDTAQLSGYIWKQPDSFDKSDLASLQTELSVIDTYIRHSQRQADIALTYRNHIETHRAKKDSAYKARETLDSALLTVEGECHEIPQQIKEYENELTQLRQLSTSLSLYEERLLRLEQRLEAAIRAEELNTLMSKHALICEKALAHAQKQAHIAHSIHTQWLHDTARSLATELIDGQPCPVCGSVAHPHPAHILTPPDLSGETTPLSLTTRSDVEKAHKEKEQADRALEEARVLHTTYTTQLSSAQEIAQGTRQELEDLIQQTRTEYTQAQEALLREQELEQKLAEQQALLEEKKNTRTHLHEQSASFDALIHVAQQEIDTAQAQLADIHIPTHDLASYCEALLHMKDTHDSLQEIMHILPALYKNIHEVQERYRHTIQKTGLDYDTTCEETLQADLLTPEQDSEYQQRIDTHEYELRTAREQLAALCADIPEGATPPDIHAHRTAYEAAQTTCSHIRAQILTYEKTTAQATGIFQDLQEAYTQLSAAEKKSGPLRRLSALATAHGPENLHSTPLASWVLISRFEEVLAAANPRLLRMSEGRYELRHSLDDGTRSHKSGLGLHIIDHDTEEIRSTRSLSGGETFYASLALALGLADVVTAETGGIELHTMFIDEGFGSLDAHKLEIVMDQLTALRKQGRTIGVISHVEEMSRRIPEQVNIRWNPSIGSTVRVRA
ncbi:AAA family ATPase [Schaalia sp. lx-100]|uniref:AAA family ATPase n=1 Tax=Schaalia sp. lx-100 TaxID=2899081 RepID=UPI001E4336C8|nr:SMC family ATPase [Schaalia sp. lx-100]MCD4557078.1 SMC family ATPase [Schaalia sp. lx-100]